MNLLLLFSMCTVALGGLVRGFSGFGAALIMTPLLALLLTPSEAVFYAAVLSLLGSLFLFTRSAKMADWRAALLLFAGSLPFIAAGNMALLYIPADTMRVVFALTILLIATATLAGWIYHGIRRKRYTLLAGAASGFMYGSVGSGGPPCSMYLSGTDDDKSRVRATVLMHANLCLLVTLCGLGHFGNFYVVPDWHLALLIGAHFAGVYGGEKLFHLMGDRHYDRIVLWFLACMGVTTLYLSLRQPLQDWLL